MCRLGSENTRPTGNRQEHAPNAVCPQANMAGKGLRAVGWQHNARHVGVARGVAVLPLSEEGSRGVSWSVGFTRVQGGDVI